MIQVEWTTILSELMCSALIEASIMLRSSSMCRVWEAACLLHGGGQLQQFGGNSSHQFWLQNDGTYYAPPMLFVLHLCMLGGVALI